jgi:UDP-glucuronate 4-epimerase
MNILVTGCAGFIGSQVADVLLQRGDHVVGIDNLNDAYDVRLKDWRLAKLEEHPNFEFHRLDLTDRRGIRDLTEGAEGSASGSFDGVINMGARAGVRQSVLDPWVYYETNVIGTLNLVDACREHGVPKFVQASTSSAYGNAPRPFREDANTDRPLSPYAASKKAAEELVHSYYHLYHMDVTVFRFFTVYGPAGRPDMSIFRFIKWIEGGEPLTVFGDGSQERDFTYVADIARGVVAALGLSGFDVINLGNDRPAKLSDVIHQLEELLGKRAEIKYEPIDPTDVLATRADITKASERLGWSPQVTLEDGLAKTVEWYRENKSWAREVRL